MPQQGMPGPSDNFRLSNPAGVGLIRNARMGGAVHQIGHSCGLGMQVPQQPQLGRQTQMQSRMHRVQQGSMQGQQIMSGVGNPFDTGLGPPGMVAGQGIQQGMSPNLMFGSEGQPVSGDVGMVAGGMRQEQQVRTLQRLVV